MPNEVSLVVKVMVCLLLVNLTALVFGLVLVGQNLGMGTQFTGLTDLQGNLNVTSHNLANSFSNLNAPVGDWTQAIVWFGTAIYDVLVFFFNFLALIVLGLWAVIYMLFIFMPSLFAYSSAYLGALGSILSLIFSLTSIILGVYGFYLLTTILGRVKGVIHV